MTPAAAVALISGLAALVTAITGLVTALRAHGRITAMTPPGKHVQAPGQQPPAGQ